MTAAIEWTPELETSILSRITQGQAVRNFAGKEGIPASSTIYAHLAESKEFAENYARAKEVQMEAMAEEILEIADDGANDTYETEDGERVNVDIVQRSRLRVDTRKWLMSKLAPKKYGDKVQQEVSGPNGAPIQASITVEFVKPAGNSG